MSTLSFCYFANSLASSRGHRQLEVTISYDSYAENYFKQYKLYFDWRFFKFDFYFLIVFGSTQFKGRLIWHHFWRFCVI